MQDELAKLSTDAAGERIDPDYVTRLFGDQINATEAIEYRRFADWKLHPSSAPAGSPDLSASRSTIDGLNHTMLTQIVAAGTCCIHRRAPHSWKPRRPP